jgi:hypothetical protein
LIVFVVVFADVLVLGVTASASFLAAFASLNHGQPAVLATPTSAHCNTPNYFVLCL